MPEIEHYEILVLGGGKGGKTLAMEMGRERRRVALVERGLIGGSCINVACIPSKTLIQAGAITDLVRHAAAFGIDIGAWDQDFARVARRTRDVVDGMVDLTWQGFRASHLELLLGNGRFVAPKLIEVRMTDGGITRLLTGERIFVDLGTQTAIPDIPGLRESKPLTHVEALKLERLPEHLIVLGGGYVGLEMAQAFRHFGARTTLIERGPRLLAREDDDVTETVRYMFEEDGIEVLTGTHVNQVAGRSGESVTLFLSGGPGERTIKATDILVATGRVPQTDGVGLREAGIHCDDRGFIIVDERLATTAPGVWALGEAAGTAMFTHAALDDYRVARSVIEGGSRTTRDRLIPSALFIKPEFARVGLNHSELRRQNLIARVARLPMALVPRARTLSETNGFMKALIDAGTDRILGFCMLGTDASEVVSVVQMAMLGGLPYTALRDAIISHPTMAEGLNLLFSRVPEELPV